MKGQFVEVVKRKIPIDMISSISLRCVCVCVFVCVCACVCVWVHRSACDFIHATHNKYASILFQLFILPSFSPYQDDFVVLHVRGEYDTVMESVLKTEFLTLLSEKYTALTQSKLSFTFNRRY